MNTIYQENNISEANLTSVEAQLESLTPSETVSLQIPDYTNPETGTKTEFGRVTVIPTVNAESCIDPRNPLTFIEPQGELATLLNHNPDLIRTPHQEGAERSPGAAFGKVMSLAGAIPELTPQQAVDLVQEWEQSEGRSFAMHEDDHTHKPGLGCGHIDKASLEENHDLYGIEASGVQAMKEYVIQKTHEGYLTAEAPVLTDTHQEKGVLIVHGENKTITSSDGQNTFFRFDATRHDQSLERLAEFVRTKGIEINTEALLAAAQQQRNATLKLLAKGLPIYEVNLETESPTSTLIQT